MVGIIWKYDCDFFVSLDQDHQVGKGDRPIVLWSANALFFCSIFRSKPASGEIKMP